MAKSEHVIAGISPLDAINSLSEVSGILWTLADRKAKLPDAMYCERLSVSVGKAMRLLVEMDKNKDNKNIRALTRENAILRETLEWYAKKEHYEYVEDAEDEFRPEMQYSHSELDSGNRARKTLTKLDKNKEVEVNG